MALLSGRWDKGPGCLFIKNIPHMLANCTDDLGGERRLGLVDLVQDLTNAGKLCHAGQGLLDQDNVDACPGLRHAQEVLGT